MCEIAPFQMECEWEDCKDRLTMCHANKLHCAVTELLQAIPLIGEIIEDYRCRGFEIKKEERYENN